MRHSFPTRRSSDLPPAVRRSYPASYPIKPAPPPAPVRILAQAPPPPQQPHVRPAERPYNYKPKHEPVASYKPLGYNYPSDPWKNPHSPVAHQPNVVYNPRTTAPQYSNPQLQYGGRPGPVQYQHYNQGYNSHWKNQGPSSGPPSGPTTLSAPSHFSQSTKQSNQYSYYNTAPPNTPKNIAPNYPKYSQGPNMPSPKPPPVSQPQDPSDGAAPIAKILGNTTGPTTSHMYANATPPSSISLPSAPSTQSQSSYLAYVQRYPYFKNAFLRRCKTYISPYSPDGGINPEWRAAHPPNTSRHPSSQRPAQIGLGLNFQNPTPSLPPIRPSPQFQSADAFKQEVAKQDAAKADLPRMQRWDYMLKQLQRPLQPAGPPNGIRNAAPQPPRPPTLPPDGTNEPASAPNQIFEQPTVLPRPIPSPLTDPSNSPKRPEQSPISNDSGTPRQVLPVFPQNMNGEAGRYAS